MSTGENGNNHQVARAGVLEVKTVTPVPNERLGHFEASNRPGLSLAWFLLIPQASREP